MDERQLLFNRIIELEDEYNKERDGADELRKRLVVLQDILTDPVNQLEQTKGGYYIYRFNLETMHVIADAIGIPKAEPVDFMRCYTLEELGTLIRPDQPPKPHSAAERRAGGTEGWTSDDTRKTGRRGRPAS